MKQRAAPAAKAGAGEKSKRAASKKEPPKKAKRSRLDADEDDPPKPTLPETWGVKLRTWQAEKPGAFADKAELAAEQLRLEPRLAWHSAIYFEELAAPWRSIYTCKGQPVVIERAWGDGSVVLASDSYFLSNEALHEHGRSPRFLAWLAGPHRLIVFDEEHHGIHNQAGVADLFRKYRLQTLVAGLVLLLALFVWQQAQPFAPLPRAAVGGGEVVSGRGSSEGLITLLRRSVPRGKLLETCIAEWKKDGAIPPADRERLDAALAGFKSPPAGEAAIVAAYRTLAAALRKRHAA